MDPPVAPRRLSSSFEVRTVGYESQDESTKWTSSGHLCPRSPGPGFPGVPRRGAQPHPANLLLLYVFASKVLAVHLSSRTSQHDITVYLGTQLYTLAQRYLVGRDLEGVYISRLCFYQHRHISPQGNRFYEYPSTSDGMFRASFVMSFQVYLHIVDTLRTRRRVQYRVYEDMWKYIGGTRRLPGSCQFYMPLTDSFVI